jgi:ribosome biogenesis protein Nip4
MIAPFLVAELVGGQSEEFINGRIIQQYRYKHFSRTAITTLAITTEIDNYCKLGNEEAAAYLWNIFAEYSAEAKEMLEHRYVKVLAKSAQKLGALTS